VAVLDSTFLIDLGRNAPATTDLLGDLLGRGRPLRVPSVVLMEVAAGAKDPGKAAADLGGALLIHPFDGALAEEGARQASDLFRRGRFPGWIDTVIAVTALQLGEELVTRAERHFRTFKGLKLSTN